MVNNGLVLVDNQQYSTNPSFIAGSQDFVLNMVVFQPAMLAYQRVTWEQDVFYSCSVQRLGHRQLQRHMGRVHQTLPRVSSTKDLVHMKIRRIFKSFNGIGAVFLGDWTI